MSAPALLPSLSVSQAVEDKIVAIAAECAMTNSSVRRMALWLLFQAWDDPELRKPLLAEVAARKEALARNPREPQ